MKIVNGFVLISLALGVGSVAVGCRQEGPVAKAGEKIDEAIDEIAHPNEGPIEEAGRKIDEAVEDVKEKVKD